MKNGSSFAMPATSCMLRPFNKAFTFVLALLFGFVAQAQTLPTAEAEPNNSVAAANPITANPAKIRGNIFWQGDADYYSFTANAGDKVYAAVQTSWAANASTDAQLTIIASDGVTVLEFDDDEGSFGGLTSSIAGTLIPTTGTYYIKVNHYSTTNYLRPYDLYLNVLSGSPTAEAEVNNTMATANPVPANGWLSGTRDPALSGEGDFFSITLNAGESVFLSLDLDPERDGVTWNGRIGFAAFGDAANQILVADDANAAATLPDGNSEAMFFTVKDAGTYYVYVDAASAAVGGPTATYGLSVAKFAAEPGYVNYAYTGGATAIPDASSITSTINIPDSKIIKDISVRINLSHVQMADLDATLTSPGGNVIQLFTDIGSTTTGGQAQMDLVLNDNNAIPPSYTIMKGVGYQPELQGRLEYFKGMNTSGTWTLKLYDDATNSNTGTLTSWSLDILEDATANTLAGMTPVFNQDFESTDGGFTHSGTADEWAWGTPATVGTGNLADFQTANSGTKCWKTDLTGTYDVSSQQVLESPDINLSTYPTAQLYISWAMKHQIESANFDTLSVSIEEVGGSGLTQDLYKWYGATQTVSVGTPSTTIGQASGWGLRYADVSAFAGKTVRFKARFRSDNTVNYSGVGIDDVKLLLNCPTITLSPTSLPNGTAGVGYSPIISQTGGAGTGAFSVSAGALPPGVSLSPAGAISGSPTATGTFNFTITFTDENTCTGSQSYSIAVNCPAPSTVLTLAPNMVCNDGSGTLLTLAGGSPAGGTYSGVGVSGGQFDPAAGTSTITYDYTDVYGCSSSAQDVMVVNLPPTVDLGGPYTQCGDTVTLDAGLGTGGSNFSESFDAAPPGITYTPGGWFQKNNSVPGTTNWFGGNTGVFAPNSGAEYLAANFNNTTGLNDISNWLLTPTLSLHNGDVLTFYTRTVSTPAFPDRLQVRMSTNGGSTNVGTTSADVGDFTNLLLDINPSLNTTDYPNVWTQFTVTVSGLSGTTNGRFAFRYFVTNAGPFGSNSDYIGIDDVVYSSAGQSNYLWSDASTNQTFNATVSGNYAVTVTDANGCTASDAASVTIHIPPAVNLGGPYEQCDDSVTLDAGAFSGTGNVDQSQTSATGGMAAFSQGDLAQSFIPAQNVICGASAYTTLGFGSGVADITIALYDNLPNAGGNLLASGTATGIAPGGVATVSWPQTNITAGNTYYLVFTSTSSAFALSGDVNNPYPGGMVFANTGYQPFAGFDYTFETFSCYSATYLWSTGANTQTITVGATGDYSVTVTDGNGCVGVDTASVIIHTSPTVNLGGPYVQCEGTVTLDAGNAGSTYAWSDASAAQTLNVTATGSYSVTVTDANTCTASDTADVTINLRPTPVTNDTVCQFATVTQGLSALGCGSIVSSYSGTTTLSDPTFTRSLSGTTYVASGTGTAVHYNTFSFTVTTTGSYTFTLCGYDTYIHLYSNSFDPLNPANNFIIADDDAAICGGGSEITVTLNAGDTYVLVVTAFSNSGVGAYTVTYTGAGSVVDLGAVSWFDAPTGGNLVGTGNPFNPVGTVLVPNTNTPGTYTFYAACTSSPDCRSAVVFVIDTTPVVDLGGPYTQCGGTVTLDAANAGSTYAWSDASNAQTLTVNATGSYSVTVTAANTCTASDMADVTIFALPTLDLGGPYTQCGDTVTLDAGAGSTTNALSESFDAAPPSITYNPGGWFQQNNSVPGTINWFGGNTGVFAPNSGAAYLAANFNSTSGANDISNWLLTPTLTLNNGDVFTFYTRTVNSPFFPDRLQVRMSTNGASTNVGTTSADVGDFTNLLLDINPSLNTTDYPNVWTQYTITVSGLGGPTSGKFAFRYFVPNGGPAGSNSDYIGIDDVQFSSSSGTTYLWSDGSTNQTLDVTTSGDYSVTITDGNGCSSSDTANVTIHIPPTVSLGGPYAQCVSATLDAGNAGSAYAWSTGETSQTVTVTATGSYSVTVTDVNGCTGSDTADVTIFAAPAVDLGGPYVQCGGTLTLDAGSGGTGGNITEGFEGSTVGTTYTPTGWFQQNNSVTGLTNWFGGNTGVFAPNSGASYLAANFNSTSGANDISNWLLTPTLTLNNGDVFSFYTRTVDFPAFPDRLQVRMSTNGASTNVGATSADVGDFTTLLLDINPSLNTTDYPNVWTQYTITVSGLGGPTAGRLAFRYFVPNGGPAGSNSDYIGLDDVQYSSILSNTYLWSDGSTGQTLTVNSTGLYAVTVTDVNGCSASDTADVTIHTPPVVDLGGPYVQCQGTVTLDAANAGSTYLWSDGSTGQTLVVAVTGSYSVTVTDGNGCTGTDAVNVVINLPPALTVSDTICQYSTLPSGQGLKATGCGNVMLSFTGQTTLQDPVFTRSVGGTSYNASGVGTAVHYNTYGFTVSTTGVYTFTLCGSFDTYLHLYANSFDPQNPAANFLIADDDGGNGTCGGGSQTTVFLTAGSVYVFVVTAFDNNGVGNYTVNYTGAGFVLEDGSGPVSWFDAASGGNLVGSGSPFNPVGTSVVPNTNTPGTYTFYVACSSTPDCRTPVDFVINPAPVVEIGGPYNQCGGSVVLDAANAGSTYTWSDSTFNQTTTASTSGTYTVTVTNTFGCTASDFTEVYIQPVPVVNLGVDVVQCGGTATLDAGNPGNTYLWSDNSTNQTLTVSSTGTYSVTVTDINSGCTGSDSVNVTINPLPVVNLGSNLTQCGGTVTLDAGNTGATFLWSTNETTQTITVSTSGIYRVTVTDANTCSATGSVNVTINTVPNLGPDKTDSVCPGNTVDLNLYYANAGYATYVWDAANPSAAGAGVYQLIVTTAAGCSDTAVVTITNRQKPDLGADATDSVCVGYTADLTALYPPDPSYVTYTWNTATPTAAAAGTYTLVVFNQSGCSDTAVATITNRQQPNLGPDQTDSVCMGYTLDLTTYYPNSGYATYTWDAATPDSVGAGVYTLIVSNTSGCFDTAVMTITNKQQPVVTLSMATEMCYTEPAFVLSGGSPSGGYYVVDDSIRTTFDPVVEGVGTHHINYVFTNASGCTDSASVDFTVHPQPQTTSLKTPELCTGSDPIDLFDYVSPDGGVFTGVGVSQHFYYPQLAGAGEDTIVYIYTDTHGCMDTLGLPILVKSSVSVSLTSSEVDYTICRGDYILFTASGAELYEFFVNGVSQGQASATDTFSTTTLASHDMITVVGSNSCSVDTSEAMIIDVITLPTVDAGADTTITLGQTVTLNAKATGATALVYLWTPDYYLNFTNVPNPEYSGPDTTMFVVRVTDTYGCWASDSVTVNVVIPDNILLPNILTPNGDGKNDLWILNSKIQLGGSHLVIFNRWGEIVFETDDYANNWDGTYKATGKKLPDGTYYYVLKVPLQNNHEYKGPINILNSDAK